MKRVKIKEGSKLFPAQQTFHPKNGCFQTGKYVQAINKQIYKGHRT